MNIYIYVYIYIYIYIYIYTQTLEWYNVGLKVGFDIGKTV